MTNEQLVFEIQHADAERKKDFLGELCRHNHGLVAKAAQRYSSASDIDDLMQEGFIGLMDAAENYDPDRGAAFTTYAMYHIRKAMLVYLRECGQAFRLPPEIAALMIRLRWLQDSYQKQYGMKINRKIAATFLGISEEKAALLLRTEKQCRTASLYTKVGEDDDMELQDVIPDENSEKQFEQIFDEDSQIKIWQAVDSLPEEMRTIVHEHYQEGMTMEAIGAKLGIPARRVRDAHYKALHRLKRGRVIQEMYYHSPYYKTGRGAYRDTNTSVEEWLVMRAERWNQLKTELDRDDFDIN